MWIQVKHNRTVLVKFATVLSGILCAAAALLAFAHLAGSGTPRWRVGFDPDWRGWTWSVHLNSAGIGLRMYGVKEIRELAEDRESECVVVHWEEIFFWRRLAYGQRAYGYTIVMRYPLLAVMFGFLPALSIVRLVRARRRVAPGECTNCRYLLRGLTSDRCPECGAPFEPADVNQQLGHDPAQAHPNYANSAGKESAGSDTPIAEDLSTPRSLSYRTGLFRLWRVVIILIPAIVVGYPITCLLREVVHVPEPETFEAPPATLESECRRSVIEYVMRTSPWVQGFARLFPGAIHCLRRGTSDEDAWWTSRVLLYGRYHVEFTTSTAWTDRERCELALASEFNFHVRECVRCTLDPAKPGEYIYDDTEDVISKSFQRDEWEAFLGAGGDFGILGIELTTDDPVPYCDTGFEAMKDFYRAYCVD